MFLKEYNRLLLLLKGVFSQHIMMESLGVQEENIIKDIKNFSRLKKLNYTAIKDITNLFRLEKETKAYLDILRIF